MFTRGSSLKILSKLLIISITFYQKVLSPLKGGNTCRFYPTCSHYAIEAINCYGPFLGLWLFIKRFIRCHPWNPGGFDPVPTIERIRK
ncbi:MAG: membrane protein insertion efficiency factor YidD [Caldisericia bacterium]|nr:membrane protein insertion efficiency factor YidD [Caldisericia bacterium]